MEGEKNIDGCFTTMGYLKGHTLREIESLLGFKKERLKLGAKVFVANRLPQLCEFELAGYTQVASHRTNEVYGEYLNRPQDKFEEDAYLIKKGIAMSCWSISGRDRIVKIEPIIKHSSIIPDAIQYPPGQAIPQWNLINKIPFREVGTILNYPDGRFELNW